MERLVLGTGPVRLGADGVKTRSDLRGYFTRTMGVQVRIVAAASYTDLLGQLSRDEVHLAWVPPVLAIQACDTLHATPLVSAIRSPGAQFFGTLFVREASEIKEPADMRGKKIGWVDKDSCSGYLFPRIALKAKGFDLANFFAEEKVLGNHEAVTRAVAAGEVDVGATYLNTDVSSGDASKVIAGYNDITSEPMRPVLRTDAIPSDMIVASHAIPDSMRQRARTVFTRMHEEPEVAANMKHLFGALSFEPADIRRYDIVRRAMSA